MATPEEHPNLAKFPFGEPRVELNTAYLQHVWGELLDNLHRAEHDCADIEGDALVGKGFILGLSAAEVVTDEQRDLMYDLLYKAREEALRRAGRHSKG